MRGPLTYYFDFVLFPLLAIVMTAFYCRSMYFVSGALVGVYLFTFIEYWVHRLALHGAFFHAQHERHHTNPKEYVVFPIWFTPTIFFGFYLVLPVSIFTGFVVGYCWFFIWHHILHHIENLGSYPVWVQQYAVWHLKHHNDDKANFGVTMNLWDWLFGTYK